MSTFQSLGLLQYHISERSACNYHRIANPMHYLKDIKAKVPVLFYNRIAYTHEQLDQAQRKGFKVVIDIDDDVVLGKDHILYPSYQQAGMTERLIGNIQRADVVMVTNAYLAGRIKPYNSNIVIVPNALPFDEGQFTRTTPEHKRKIVYVGGTTHFEDLKLVQPAVPREHMVIAGNEPALPIWTRIRSLFSFAEFRSYLPVDRYMQHYDGYSVAIAPLADTVFNRGKSNLKALEAGAKGLAFVASAVHPYMNERDKGVVLYAASKADWRSQLKRLVDDAVFCSERAQMLAEHVRKHYTLKTANEIRRQVIESFA